MIATGYDRLAMDLEEHINNYIPQGWVEPVKSVAHVPYIFPQQAQALMTGYQKGNLDQAINDIGTQNKNYTYHFISNAIKDYFTNENFSSFANEL